MGNVAAQRAKLQRELQSINRRKAFLENVRDRLLAEMEAWFAATVDSQTIGANGCSRVHKLEEAIQQDRYFSSVPFDPTSDGLRAASVFVVSHDWAAAFRDSLPEDETTIKLPFDACMFEFVINGKPVLFWAIDITDTINGMLFVSFGELGWVGWDVAKIMDAPLTQYVWRQVVAISVSLDAEIATAEVVRAPRELNAKRERQGKRPLLDYRVIDLAKRHRIRGVTVATETKQKRRLHFRRGHWRHYPDHKTWIKWQLVGDPDLGFINSHYKL